MRRPRDLHNYLPAAEGAAFLRRKADEVERGAESAPLVKIVVDVWCWNPMWTDPAKAPPFSYLELRERP